MQPITEQEKTLAGVSVNGFFLILKSLVVIVCLCVGVLAISQSAVAPVNMRLLGMHAVEYTVKKVKPYRMYFPKPYMKNVEEKTR